MKANVHHKLGGGVYLSVENSHGGSTDVTIVPSQSGKNKKPRAGFCGHDRLQFCKRPWPTGLLGPKPTAPVFVPAIDLQTCGRSCTSNYQCGGPSDWSTGCRCVVPKDGFLLDAISTVLPSGNCLRLPTEIISQTGSLLGKRSRVPMASIANDVRVSASGRRSIDIATNQSSVALNQTLDEWLGSYSNNTNYGDSPSTPEAIDSENPQANLTSWISETSLEAYTSLNSLPSYVWCACNCTYVSWGCCSSSSGIVHEPPNYRKGSMANCTSTNANTAQIVKVDTDNKSNTSVNTSSEDAYASSVLSSSLSRTSSTSSIGSSEAASTSVSAAASEPSVCTTKCRSAARQCQYWCQCNAPPVGLFFWFQGACGLRNKKRSLSPRSDLDPTLISDVSERRRDVHQSLSINSTARELLGDTLTPLTMRPPPGHPNSGTVLGYKASIDMIPGAPLPAPCNDSYVSYKCADSDDGIVQEGPEFWLGALLPENATDLPPAPETWLRINGLSDSFNSLNKYVT